MDQERADELLAELGGIDTRGWALRDSSGAGAYFEASPNVLVAVPHRGHAQREADARRSLALFHRLASARGRPQAIIVLVDRVSSQDAASRRVWSEPEAAGLRSSLALVCSSPLARAIGSFFIGLNRPAVPTRMFKTFEAALEWSQARVDEAFDRGALPGISPGPGSKTARDRPLEER